MYAPVATQEIAIHRIAMSIGCGASDKSGCGLITAIDKVRIGDRGLKSLFTQRSQTAFLPIRTKGSEVLCRQTVHNRYDRQTGSGFKTYSKQQQADHQRMI